MILTASIAAVAVVAVAIGLAVTAGRRRRVERHEVEKTFSGDSDDSGDRVWWEDRT